MRRDMDLIRELLLKLEALSKDARSHFVLDGGESELAVEGYTATQIHYHLALIREAGFIEPCGKPGAFGIAFQRLSWNGHDFIDSVRDPKLWHETKQGVQMVGGFSWDLIAALAKGLIKKQIEQRTGVKLDL